MSRIEISDPRKWRISRSGFSIRTGWGDADTTIADYPATVFPLDPPTYECWLEQAQKICDAHNATLN